MKEMPHEVHNFIENTSWVFAKTYAETWPHEYIVRDKVDESLFVRLVQYIRTEGYDGKFYSKKIIYFDESGMVYWTTGAPIEETTIINRCKKEESYEYRLKNNQLPNKNT